LQNALNAEELSDGEIAAIKEGIADLEASRTHDGTSVLADIRQIVGRVK